MNLGRLGAVARKEVRQLRRDPTTIGMLLGIPIIQLLLFGYAIRTEVENLPLAVYDAARTEASRELVSRLEATGSFELVERVEGYDRIRDGLRSGRIHAALVIPSDFPRELKRGEPAAAQLLVDAADPLSSQAAISAAATLALLRPGAVATSPGTGPDAAAATSPAGVGGGIDLHVRPLYNPGLRSPVYIVPGIIGVLLSITMMLITGLALVRERERGTLEQLIVTPITRGELMVGKIAPYIGIAYFQVTAVLVLGHFVFDVPIRGSLFLLYAISFAFIVANLGFGLFISTIAATQQQAMMMGYFFLLPNILLSGFMFPREAMPWPAQWLGLLLPLTYYLDVLRGIILRDAGIGALWDETLLLALFSVALLGFSVARFSKTIE